MSKQPDELDLKLEWVQSCKCERCPKDHDQSKTGCPSCDFAHADYPLFTNKEVLQLISDRETKARIDELEKLPISDYEAVSEEGDETWFEYISLKDRDDRLTQLNSNIGKED